MIGSWQEEVLVQFGYKREIPSNYIDTVMFTIPNTYSFERCTKMGLHSL